MKNKILLLLTLSLSFFSCSEKEFEIFDAGNQIFFSKFFEDELFPGKAEADSTVCSFFFYSEDVETITADLEVQLSGKLLEEDTQFKLKVVEEETTAKPDEYTIDEFYTFHSNTLEEDSKYVKDVIKVKLNKSERINTLPDGVRLVVEIVPNEKLGVGQHERRRAIIRYSTKESKPEWWDDEVEDNLLGIYSQKKYKLFLKYIDTKASLNEDMIENNPSEARKLAMKFKEWLIDNPQTEDNGEPMAVAI